MKIKVFLYAFPKIAVLIFAYNNDKTAVLSATMMFFACWLGEKIWDETKG